MGASGTLVVIAAGEGGIDELLRFFRRAVVVRFVPFFFVDGLFVAFPALVVFFAAFLPDRFDAERFELDFAARFLVDDFRDLLAFLLAFLATMVISPLETQFLSCMILLNLTNRLPVVYAYKKHSQPV